MATMTSAEFAEWVERYRREPWGEWRLDYNFGISNSLLANINRDPKSRRAPYTPSDFMPFVERPTENAAAKLRASLGHLVVKRKGK